MNVLPEYLDEAARKNGVVRENRRFGPTRDRGQAVRLLGEEPWGGPEGT